MTISTATAPDSAAAARPSHRPVQAWLYVVAAMIVAMVVVGGATRLTESGLSITEWQPIHGVVPPMNDAEWQQEFAKYKEIPQYQIVNKGMTLAEFKAIYWWEWAHRLLGRLIGAVFFLPLVFFWVRGRIPQGMKGPLLALFVLGGLQGAIGWWMVASGLAERTDVSQYRLAIHLTLACAILAYAVWLARGLSPLPTPKKNGLRLVAAVILVLVFLQIFLGGLVAGLNAGLTYNTWPLMDGALIPEGLLDQKPVWRNFFENILTVQFDHRMVAYALAAVALMHAMQASGTEYGRTAAVLAGLVVAQACLGIATLLMVVPLHVALSHQFGAVVVLWVAVAHARRLHGGHFATARSQSDLPSRPMPR